MGIHVPPLSMLDYKTSNANRIEVLDTTSVSHCSYDQLCYISSQTVVMDGMQNRKLVESQQEGVAKITLTMYYPWYFPSPRTNAVEVWQLGS